MAAYVLVPGMLNPIVIAECARHALALALLVATAAVAQEGRLVQVRLRPELRAVRLTTASVPAGDIRNDAVWRAVQPVSDFVEMQPFEGATASKRAGLHPGYAETSPWLGAVAYDDHSETIIVADGDRDSSPAVCEFHRRRKPNRCTGAQNFVVILPDDSFPSQIVNLVTRIAFQLRYTRIKRGSALWVNNRFMTV